MIQTIQQKYNKDLLKQLETETFEGRIVVVNNQMDMKKAVEYLKLHDLLGIDTETKPSFKKGHVNKVAILQIATLDTAFIFQLKFTELSDELIALLEDENICKVGLSLKDDIHMLRQRHDFKPGYFVDIQQLVKNLGIEDMSLQKIYANIFDKRISKRKQLSNWNADILDEGQKKYAALDAVACLRIFLKVRELLKNDNYTIIPSPDESQPHKDIDNLDNTRMF